MGLAAWVPRARALACDCEPREKCAGNGGPAHRRRCYDAALGSIGSQMLILRVSGIRKSASTKHTAGTAIG